MMAERRAAESRGKTPPELDNTEDLLRLNMTRVSVKFCRVPLPVGLQDWVWLLNTGG